MLRFAICVYFIMGGVAMMLTIIGICHNDLSKATGMMTPAIVCMAMGSGLSVVDSWIRRRKT